MHLMQRQRRHIISIFVTFSRKMFLRLRLKFHLEFFGGEHNVGEHDADAEFAHRMEALARKAGF